MVKSVECLDPSVQSSVPLSVPSVVLSDIIVPSVVPSNLSVPSVPRSLVFLVAWSGVGEC